MSRPPIDRGVVLLTGASSGIGAAMAALLAPRARVLILVARRKARLDELAAALNGQGADIEVRPADLADPSARAGLIAGVLEDHGAVDVLINNAGVGDFGLFERRDPRKVDAMLQVNVVGLTDLTRALLPGMLARGRGGVLMVSSGFGLHWMPGFSAYAATKHYVTALSEGLRAELAGTGVVVTQLCPGPVATEFVAHIDAPTDGDVPSVLQISAADCARSGLAGFDRGRALVVPGPRHWLMIQPARIFPRWLVRPVLTLAGRILRRQLAEPPPPPSA